ncbi:MAG: Rrf2 family transcriptional regulator [Planctomycetaceae bacterium]|nr:Rrf2 family transcriptional regulator [Planctomycetaceae bacterium]
MSLSQKCQYAIRSIFELSKRYGKGPIRTNEIADAQAIPQRFLENILNELKSTGLIESRRGMRGGYLIARNPADLTVGEIIRLIDGPLDPVKCIGDSRHASCPLQNECSLINLWNRAKAAVEDIYDHTTFQDLVEQEQQMNRLRPLDFTI